MTREKASRSEEWGSFFPQNHYNTNSLRTEQEKYQPSYLQVGWGRLVVTFSNESWIFLGKKTRTQTVELSWQWSR